MVSAASLALMLNIQEFRCG